MGRFSWITCGALSVIICSLKGEAEADLTHTGGGNVGTAERDLETEVIQPQAKECQQSPDAGKSKEQVQKHGTAHNLDVHLVKLISDFQPSELRE